VRSFRVFKADYSWRLLFSPDGGTLFLVGKHMIGLDASSGKELFDWRLKPMKSNSGITEFIGGQPVDEDERIAYRTVALSPNGTMFACILDGGFGREPVADRVAVYDARMGTLRRRWSDSGKPSLSFEQLRFSPDGKLLASSDGEGIHLWEVVTGKEVCTFRGHRGEVQSLGFSANGRRLASTATDSTVLLWDLTLASRPFGPVAEREVNACWSDLADQDAARAQVAVWRLADTPGVSIPFLRQRLKPVTNAEAEAIRRHIKNLDSTSFAVRQEAFRNLKELGPAAVPALRQAAEEKPPLEVRRRLDQLWEAFSKEPVPAEPLRTLRALAMLEYAGTPEARQLLQKLAEGAPGAWLTQEAGASLGRLAKLPRTE
jgi:hypothetical protein